MTRVYYLLAGTASGEAPNLPFKESETLDFVPNSNSNRSKYFKSGANVC